VVAVVADMAAVGPGPVDKVAAVQDPQMLMLQTVLQIQVEVEVEVVIQE
jgi:hypothetical protein